MAPNRRSENKANVNAWITRDLKAQFEAIAKSRGVTLSQLLTELVEQQVRQQKSTQSRNDRNAGNGN